MRGNPMISYKKHWYNYCIHFYSANYKYIKVNGPFKKIHLNFRIKSCNHRCNQETLGPNFVALALGTSSSQKAGGKERESKHLGQQEWVPGESTNWPRLAKNGRHPKPDWFILSQILEPWPWAWFTRQPSALHVDAQPKLLWIQC